MNETDHDGRDGTSEAPSILLVDDNPANLSLLVDALHAAGYRPLIANGGVSALQRLQQVRPALILLDMRMPSLDGMETMARIRAHPDWREIPVIFVTVVEDPEQKIEALSAGAVDYVTKPFHVQEVLARIRTHLRLKSLQAALSVELEWRASTERVLQSSLEQAVVVATREGRVQFCTYRAGQLAKHYLGELIEAGDESMLPEKLLELVRLRETRLVRYPSGRGELEVRFIANPASDDPVTLLFEERRKVGDHEPLKQLGLTDREAEVLFWISRGKSNPEIGMIIGVAAGTVKKHAENIFAKLGVPGRPGAMLAALSVLEE